MKDLLRMVRSAVDIPSPGELVTLRAAAATAMHKYMMQPSWH